MCPSQRHACTVVQKSLESGKGYKGKPKKKKEPDFSSSFVLKVLRIERLRYQFVLSGK